MVVATEKTHCSLEPMYTTVNPNLPTFVSTQAQRMDQRSQDTYVFDKESDKYVLWKPKAKREQGWVEHMQNKLSALVSGSGEEAKKFLHEENKTRARSRKEFLSDKRTAMITNEETKIILQRSFEYIAALMEFNLVNLEFQFNHYLYQGFKDALKDKFCAQLVISCDFEKLIDHNPDVDARMKELTEQIDALRDSLRHVAGMQKKLRVH